MIFVDTSFWLALRNRRDAHHEDAARLLRAHGADRLVTTSQVRGEGWTFLRHRMGHRPAVSFLDSLEASPRLEVLFLSEELEDDALRWLRRHDERDYSFVDATSFLTMRSLGISDALTFDDDFAAAGFTVLNAPTERKG